jgi:uncharacterized CHY-type Zn-finger protein
MTAPDAPGTTDATDTPDVTDATDTPDERAFPTAGDDRFPVPLRGVGVDAETRCLHYNSPVDVVAIRFPCCDTFFPCHACHDDCTDHDAERWPADRFDADAVLCGACEGTLTVAEYLDCEHDCPHCGASFNPGCAAHADRYFAVD